jgi:hypothetical protein
MQGEKRRRPGPRVWLGVAVLATAWGDWARAQEGHLPVRPAIDQRASPLGPLVTDFMAPGEPPRLREPEGAAGAAAPCQRCGAVHWAHAACVYAYKGTAGWLETPYHDQNLIYGYYDYAYGRGPLLTLGDRALTPGFRGYGLLGTPGYGPGLRPTSRVDLEVLGGHWYPEAKRLWPRWSHWPK